MRRLDHLKKVREHFGTLAALVRVGDRALQTLGVEVHKVLRQDSSLYDKEFSPDPRCTFRRLTIEDVERLSADPQNRIPPSFTERARSAQHLCFATFCDSRLAGYGWYALGSIDAEQNAGVPMSYPADTACLYRGFTHPDYRGQLLHASIRPQLLAALAEHGITKLLALVSWTNWPSLRYCYRVGYQDLGHLVTVRHSNRHWFSTRKATAYGIKFGVTDGQSRQVPSAAITFRRDEASFCSRHAPS